MRVALFLLVLFSPVVSHAQPAEAQLWRCGMPGIAPGERIAACTAALQVAKDEPAVWHNRALARIAIKDYRNAVMDFTAALRLKKDPQTQTLRGIAFYELGEYERALLDLEGAVGMAPKDAHAHNSLAWTLATASTPGFRDGKRAVELARKACTLGNWASPDHIDTLAAAYAEAGDYAEAVRWQERALADPQFPKGEDLKEARQRLALYKARKPYRHSPAR